MGNKWHEFKFKEVVTKEMKETLPNGLRCVNQTVKVPPYSCLLRDLFFKWKGEEGLTSQFGWRAV